MKYFPKNVYVVLNGPIYIEFTIRVSLKKRMQLNEDVKIKQSSLIRGPKPKYKKGFLTIVILVLGQPMNTNDEN